MSQIPETGPIVKPSVSTTVFYPRQTRKGLNVQICHLRMRRIGVFLLPTNAQTRYHTKHIPDPFYTRFPIEHLLVFMLLSADQQGTLHHISSPAS